MKKNILELTEYQMTNLLEMMDTAANGCYEGNPEILKRWERTRMIIAEQIYEWEKK